MFKSWRPNDSNCGCWILIMKPLVHIVSAAGCSEMLLLASVLEWIFRVKTALLNLFSILDGENQTELFLRLTLTKTPSPPPVFIWLETIQTITFTSPCLLLFGTQQISSAGNHHGVLIIWTLFMRIPLNIWPLNGITASKSLPLFTLIKRCWSFLTLQIHLLFSASLFGHFNNLACKEDSF